MRPGLALFAASPKLTTRKYTIGQRDYLYREIETDAGITGIGEGSIQGDTNRHQMLTASGATTVRECAEHPIAVLRRLRL